MSSLTDVPRTGLLRTGAIRIWPQSYAHLPIMASTFLNSARLEFPDLVLFSFQGTFMIARGWGPSCGDSHGHVGRILPTSDHVLLGQAPQLGSVENVMT